MLTEKQLQMQQTIIGLQRRLLKAAPGRIARTTMRYSCGWATDEEFQRILDSLVTTGIAIREKGRLGAEWYRSAMEVKAS
jgi:hypothetical protein